MKNKETLMRDYSNRSCQTCNLFNINNSTEKVCELKLENKCASYANDETLSDFWISCLYDKSDSVLYKQKTTIKEVAEIFVNNRFTKQICGDEFYPDIYASKEAIVESHILFAKWQQKNSYSEEEVIKIVEKSRETGLTAEYLLLTEHFKNK